MREKDRIKEMVECAQPGRLLGPYLGEREWGTVREDYSENGTSSRWIGSSDGRSGRITRETLNSSSAYSTNCLLNFTWWVNRKGAAGRNIFQGGGFLGLDNIGVFDRSAALLTGDYVNQADGTSWMAMYSLNLMRIALELAQQNHVYEDIATKLFEHFLDIARAMTNIGDSGIGLWNEEDGFFYDVMNLAIGQNAPLRVR